MGNQLHFRGKQNLGALLADLLANKGMDKATEVVISGRGSGGALAVYHPARGRDPHCAAQGGEGRGDAWRWTLACERRAEPGVPSSLVAS